MWRRNERKYRQLFTEMVSGAAVHEIICDTNGQPIDYHILEINRACESLLGVDRESVIGKTFREFIPDGENDWIEMFGKVALTGEPMAYRRYFPAIDKFLEGTAYSPIKNQVATTFTDISGRIHAEKEGERQQRLFETMFNTIPDAVVILNADGQIQLANKGVEAIFGYAVEALIGQSAEFLCVDKDNFRHREESHGNQKSETQGLTYVARYRHKDGQIFSGETFCAGLYDENQKWIGNFEIIRDITQQEQSQARLKQAQKMEAIGTLAGGIAHDFNNILFPILARSEMLLSDLPPDSPYVFEINEIFKAGQRAKELIQQILSFSRQTEHKRIALRIQPVVKEVIKLARAIIPANIELTHYLRSDCGPILADPIHVHQIVMNLITNAFHAVEQKGGRISLILRQEKVSQDHHRHLDLSSGEYAVLTCSDNGCGMGPETLKNIFEPYFTTKGQRKGTGLGLSVVYGLVKDYSGAITVQSEVGWGSIFELYFPVMQAPAADDPMVSGKELPRGQERILIVDDDPAIAYTEAEMLKRLGYQSVYRTSSIEALEAFKAHPHGYDLIITDMAMPNMTGNQLAREMIKTRPDIPIIICTGFSERINHDIARRVGAKGLLMKPVLLSDLAQGVRAALDEVKGTAR